MRFRILGPLEVLSPDGWTAISAAKWRSLLAALLLRHGRLVPTESLIDELWGDNPPSTANNLVSIYVHRLKKVIGDTEGRMLVYRAPGYMLRVAPGDLDLEHFESLAAEGSGALAAGQQERAAELLGQALGLWRGRLLADVPPTPLLATNADRTDELWLTTTELRVAADLACGRAIQVIPELRGLVLEHPLRERLWALLIQALEEAGRRAEALDTYAQARQVISDELGVDPGSELQRLYAELLAADAAVPSAPPAAKPRPQRAAPASAAPGITAPAARPPRGPDSAPGAGGDVAGDAGTAEPAAEPPGSIVIGTLAEPAAAVPGLAGTESGAAEGTAGLSPSVLRPAQLPADIGDFTGRAPQVEYLCARLLEGNSASSPGAVRIAVVNGAGGLGKTTLAVHAAHKISAQFPDGQLYVDLLGASPQSASPGEVLARFLRDLGVEGDKIPARDDERAALYRTALTGRRVLILLDNARDAAQVRPLLPGSSSCAVLVTTRNRTADLASTRLVDLNVLEDSEALELFSRIVGQNRAAAEPDATAEVLVACAGLPLAIRICAARLAARSQWQIATLAGRLRHAHRRLDELRIGDLAVRASFQVSYDSIRASGYQTDPARVFRLLGLWQGSSISLAAAAALVGEPEDDIADALESLVDANLLESPAPDRYRFHDLLKVYATERAQTGESVEDQLAAVGRLIRWYVRTADAAAQVVAPHRYHVPLPEDDQRISSQALSSPAAALTWYDQERSNVLSASRQAAAVGRHDLAWRLPTALFPLFNRRDNWADCIVAHRIAVDSARIAGHRLGEGWALHNLGQALVRVRDAEALRHIEQALVARREMEDHAGEAQTVVSLADAYHKLQGTQEAREHLLKNIDLVRGHSSLYGIALNNLGEFSQELGRLTEAADYFEQARIQFASVGPSYGEGHALHNLSHVYLDLGRPVDALGNASRALAIHEAAGDLLGQALALKYLGEAQLALGQDALARTAWETALTRFQQLGEAVESAEIQANLASLELAAIWYSFPMCGKYARYIQLRDKVRSGAVGTSSPGENPKTMVPDADPETMVPDTMVPDTMVPDADPETMVPDTMVPDAEPGAEHS
jgi:DNA-binding SARP family transcriptional activator